MEQVPAYHERRCARGAAAAVAGAFSDCPAPVGCCEIDAAIQRHRDTGTQGHRDTGTERGLAKAARVCGQISSRIDYFIPAKEKNEFNYGSRLTRVRVRVRVRVGSGLSLPAAGMGVTLLPPL